MSALSRLAAAARSFVGRRRGSTTATRTAGSSLAGLANRARTGRIDRRLPPTIDIPTGSGPTAPPIDARHYLGQLERLARGETIDPAIAAEIERQLAGEGGPPPPPPPPVGSTEAPSEYDDIETLGRDLGYDQEDFNDLQRGQIHVSSSNIYSYFYQAESKYSGIVYVTFLSPAPKGQPRTGPGPTYAYYDVNRGKFARFQKDTEGSAGGAVWDHLRVRGTLWNHQHRYRLIHVSGEYIPRRATFRGFRTRYLRPIGRPNEGKGPITGNRGRELARRGFQRSTLPEQLFDAAPDRGAPDRGTPNRGR